MNIREATPTDHAAIWAILEPIFRAGETYTVDRDIAQADAIAYWCGPAHRCFVAEADGRILGTYYLRRNQGGGGAHVCNCGYATAQAARGQGVARAMLEHSLELAPRLGFSAMQFNFVVATNTRAVEIWRNYGFETVGRLPGAFHHPKEGPVDALVMYRQFEDAAGR